MDAFGIGAGIKGAVNVYLHGARRTGRTTTLLESLQDGDRVVCLTLEEARRLRTLAHELGKDHCQFLNLRVNEALELFRLGTPKGRTIFDHAWVEAYYLAQLEDAAEVIDRVQREASFPGMAHVETRLAAKELHRWTRL